MRTIKLDFTDFWPGFSKTDNYFYDLLSKRYDIVISDSPDFLIYSCYGKDYSRYNCIRIFYTGENQEPNFQECNYAFSFDYLQNPDNYRLPHYALYIDPNRLIKPDDLDFDAIMKEKTRFCSFVVSNPHGRIRNEFFFKLSKYKKIDSGGRLFNNVGAPARDKYAFLKTCKFDIVFENASYPGYTTEKIIGPMLVNSIPIYWGNRLVDRDFNPKSFINYYDYMNFDLLIERIIEIDNDERLWLDYLRQPFYRDNVINEFIRPENVLKQFDYIFNNDRIPVAQKRKTLSYFFIAHRQHIKNLRRNPGLARRLVGQLSREPRRLSEKVKRTIMKS
jgi:hypothetical protein